MARHGRGCLPPPLSTSWCLSSRMTQTASCFCTSGHGRHIDRREPCISHKCHALSNGSFHNIVISNAERLFRNGSSLMYFPASRQRQILSDGFKRGTPVGTLRNYTPSNWVLGKVAVRSIVWVYRIDDATFVTRFVEGYKFLDRFALDSRFSVDSRSEAQIAYEWYTGWNFENKLRLIDHRFSFDLPSNEIYAVLLLAIQPAGSFTSI